MALGEEDPSEKVFFTMRSNGDHLSRMSSGRSPSNMALLAEGFHKLSTFVIVSGRVNLNSAGAWIGG